MIADHTLVLAPRYRDSFYLGYPSDHPPTVLYVSRPLQSCCCKKRRRLGATNPVKLVGSSSGSHIQKCGAPGTITVRTKKPACLSAVTNASDCESCYNRLSGALAAHPSCCGRREHGRTSRRKSRVSHGRRIRDWASHRPDVCTGRGQTDHCGHERQTVDTRPSI